jgi:choline kinase
VAAFCDQFGDDVRVVINDVYDRTNNMYSLRLALNSAPHSDMVISNGDVVFDETIVADIAAASGDNLIAVEPGRYIEESMKVAVDGGGRIVALNKALRPDAAYGVSIDLYSFTAPAIASILRTADRLIDRDKEANLWTEVAIEQTLPEVAVKPFDIRGRRWIEIDNFDDLAEGERLFSVAAS